MKVFVLAKGSHQSRSRILDKERVVGISGRVRLTVHRHRQAKLNQNRGRKSEGAGKAAETIKTRVVKYVKGV